MTFLAEKALKALYLLADVVVAREHELDKGNNLPIRKDADEEN